MGWEYYTRVVVSHERNNTITPSYRTEEYGIAKCAVSGTVPGAVSHIPRTRSASVNASGPVGRTTVERRDTYDTSTRARYICFGHLGGYPVGDRLRRRRSALPAATTARRGATAGSGPGGGRTARVATGHGNRGCWASSARLSGDHHGVPGCWVCLDSGRLDLGRRTLGMANGPLGASATPRHAMGAPALCLSWRPASLCPRWLEISAITAKPHHEYCTMQIVHGSHVDADKLCYRSAARRGWIHAGADRGRGAP